MKNAALKTKHEAIGTGMSIRVLSGLMIVAAVLSIVFTLFELQKNILHTQALYASEQERQQCDQAIQQLMDGSDYLTSQLQQFVIRGERQYMDNYWTELTLTKRRDKALETIRRLNLTAREHDAAEAGKSESDSLVSAELWAMRMVSEYLDIDEANMPADVAALRLTPQDAALSDAEKREAAIDFVFGPSYSIYRDNIRANVAKFRSEISNRFADEALTALTKTEFTTYLMALGLLILFALLSFSIFLFTKLVVVPLVTYSGELSKNTGGRFVRLRERGAMELRKFVSSFNQLSAEVAQNTERLAKLGYIDFLTDVPNRASITEYVSDLIAKNEAPIGLMIIDIDNFKHFNDTFGHAIGDLVLRAVAQAVCSALPSEDGCSGRLCGEEFIVAMKNADKRTLAETAEMILRKVRLISAQSVKLPEEKNFSVTVSVGGMLWQGDGAPDFTALLSKADKALYVSKGTGKNKYTFFGDI